MPKGPQGQKRPADVIGAAIQIAKIVTGEIKETKRASEKDYTRRGGLAGGKTRAEKLTSEKRSEISRVAANARWKTSK
ncbi:MAG: RNA-binding protein [Nitrospinae bacterium]|nr:RNA-binding protein [Nitrospinota bacterium]